MARAKISLAEIDKALHQGWTQRLGEPNWNANFAPASPAPLPVLNAFIEALAQVKTMYDVDDDDHALMLR